MLKQRVITAAICIPLFLLFIYLGGKWLGALLIVLSLLGCWEFLKLARNLPESQQYMWLIAGWAYIIAGFTAFYGIRSLGGTLWQLIIIWTTDTLAYEIGRRYGKHKLAPQISPNKTWEGALAGLAGALILGTIYGLIFMDRSFGGVLVISLLVSAIGQIGDLLESKIKRMAGVKDSGNLLPGHGGILDRFDSILLSSMFLYLLLLI